MPKMARKKENKMDKLKQYIMERDELLKNIETLSLGDIKEYCKKWKLPMPMPLFTNEQWVKGSLHKARLGLTKLNGVSKKQLNDLKEKSKKELDKLGWDYLSY